MSAIRDKVKTEMVDIMSFSHFQGSLDTLRTIADKILSLSSIAVVDREAELPISEIATLRTDIIKLRDAEVLKASWVKEVNHGNNKR